MSAPLRWKLLGGFLLVFIAGLVAGLFLGAVQARHRRVDFDHHDALTARIRDRMQSRLDLTPEQVTKIEPIFDKAARQLEAIRKETNLRVREVFNAADDEFEPELTPAQKAKLEAFEAQKDREARKDQKSATQVVSDQPIAPSHP